MVKVLSTLLCLPGSKPRHRTTTGRKEARHSKKEKYTRTEKGDRGQGEGPRTAETWYVSRHYELRTEVWRGCTPKVSKL